MAGFFLLLYHRVVSLQKSGKLIFFKISQLYGALIEYSSAIAYTMFDWGN